MFIFFKRQQNQNPWVLPAPSFRDPHPALWLLRNPTGGRMRRRPPGPAASGEGQCSPLPARDYYPTRKKDRLSSIFSPLRYRNRRTKRFPVAVAAGNLAESWRKKAREQNSSAFRIGAFAPFPKADHFASYGNGTKIGAILAALWPGLVIFCGAILLALALDAVRAGRFMHKLVKVHLAAIRWYGSPRRTGGGLATLHSH